jgi:hypothetical protein
VAVAADLVVGALFERDDSQFNPEVGPQSATQQIKPLRYSVSDGRPEPHRLLANLRESLLGQNIKSARMEPQQDCPDLRQEGTDRWPRI